MSAALLVFLYALAVAWSVPALLARLSTVMVLLATASGLVTNFARPLAGWALHLG